MNRAVTQAWQKSRSGVAFTFFLLTSAFIFSSCGNGKKVPGLEGFHTGVVQKRLYVSFISKTLQWDVGLTIPIPGLRDATVSVAPDLSSDGTVFQFSIGLEALLNHGQAFPLTGLPDGRPLPDIQGGVLPRWDVDIKKLRMSLYLSNDAFGIFVPLAFLDQNGVGLPVQISVDIEDERGNRLGRVYALPMNINRTGSGLFILLPYLGGVGNIINK
ncbi:MAG: hypothetical protein AABZ55_01435 [Bdellovibrionota bacterium]